MDIKQLRYFIALSQHGNMTHAAQELYITQQALSKAIRRFEDDLGVPLFERTTQGFVLTKYGKILLPYAKKAIRDVDAALHVLSDMKHSLVTIHMGYVAGCFNFMSAIPPCLLAEWEGNRPNTSIFVQENAPDELIQMVLDEELDIAYIVDDKQAKIKGIVSYELTSESLYFLIHENNPLSGKQDISFADLRELPVLLGKIGPAPEQPILCAYRNAGYLPRIYYFNGPFSQCAERVRIGEGIMIAGKSYCMATCSQGLVAKPFPDQSSTISHTLIYKKGRDLIDSVQNLISFIKKNYVALV